MFLASNFVVFLLAVLLFGSEPEAANITALISKSSNPSFAVEGKNFTLQWKYTLDAPLGSAQISIIDDNGKDVNIAISFRTGVVTVQAQFQARFRAQITDTRAELTILAVQRSDEENYNFNLLSNKGGGISEPIRLVVNFSASITNITGQNVLEGENVTLRCLAEGKPEPTITWTRLSDNQAVTMPLINIIRNDSRAYRCTAYNGLGIPATREISIDVQYHVEATACGTNATLAEGGVKNLSCPVNGNPRPNIKWYKGSEASGNPLSSENVLTIKDIMESVCYTCVASNSLGTPVSISHCLIVNGTVTTAPSTTVSRLTYHPFNTDFSTNLTSAALLNKTFYLMCSAEANPAADYRLYKEDKSVANITAGSKSIGVYSTSVSDRVNQVVYKCIPFNSFGDGPTKILNVPVHYPAEATRSGENATVGEGGSKTLTCPVVGNPEPNIKWFKGSEASGTPVSVERDLTVKDVRESACYSCVASNSLGTPLSISQCLIVVGKSVTRVPSTAVPQKFKCSCRDNETTLSIIIGVLVIIIIALIAVIIWQQRKLRVIGNRRSYEVPEEKDTGFYDNEVAMKHVNPTHLRPKNSTQLQIPNELKHMPLQGVSPTEEGSNSPETLASNVEYAPLDVRTRSWEVARNDVKVEKIIGKGAFGQVAMGTANNLPLRSGTTTVAIKMVKANAPETDKRDLEAELELMKTLKPHPHVIKLLGCVTESEPLLVLIEYVPYGDLLGHLRKSRGLNDTYYKDPDIKPKTSLTSQQLIKFAWQIADGMSYLSLRKVIHRDLAARNVLVGEREICKITDFGMARDVQGENIYERKTKGRLPVKWTAYESLLYGQYTTKSDVWSYGVVLYELSTIGGSPYPRMEGRKIASLLQQGYRMPKPEHVDNDLYQIMRNCWQSEPEARPSFSDLTQQLKRMENQHKKLINMHIYDNTLYANLEDLNA